MPLSAEQFQAWIKEQEDDSRLQDYTDYDNYYYGNFDAIDMPRHVEESLGVDLAIYANYCRPIVDSKVQYICAGPVAITVPYDAETEAAAKEFEKYLYDVYKANGLLYRNTTKGFRIHSKKGDVYLKVWADEGSKSWRMQLWRKFRKLFKSQDAKYREFVSGVKVRVLKPDNVFPKYSDDDYEDMELCAIQYYEYDDEGEKQWRTQVWYPDVMETWVRKDDEDKAWKKADEEINKYGFIPIIHIKNGNDDRAFGVSDIKVMTHLQQLLNKTYTDCMLVMDQQAFQRLFVIGAMVKRGTKWDVSPGTVSEIPNADAKVEFVPVASIEPFLKAVEMLKQSIHEVTQTPQVALGTVPGGIPSGYALKVQYQPLENKANEAILAFQNAYIDLNYMLFAIAAHNGHNFKTWDSEVAFKSGLPTDMSAIVERHEKQLGNGTISVETAMQEEGIQDTEAEKEKIEGEQVDVYGGVERQVQEAEELARILEGTEFTTTPEPEETEEG